jgi:hypothetical protein
MLSLQFLEFSFIFAIYVPVMLHQLRQWHHYHNNKTTIKTNPRKIALASNNVKEGTDISCPFDMDSIPFVIDSSASCIICNHWSQFVGSLCTEKLSVETSHGTALSNYVETISLLLTANNGTTMQYHIPDAIYDPNSPFNILGNLFGGHSLVRMIRHALPKTMMGFTLSHLCCAPISFWATNNASVIFFMMSALSLYYILIWGIIILGLFVQ